MITRESIELWLPCKSFPNLEVSNQGRVRVFKSLKSSNIGRILKQRDDKDGYKRVAINKTTARVHRLVAEAFIPNPNSNEVVHHKDNVKHNNDASNLEWTTISYNTKYAYFVNALRSPLAKYIRVSIDGNIFSYYDSCSQCAKCFDLNRDTIEKCVSRKELLFDFITIEHVESIPIGSETSRTLTNKSIARKIRPYWVSFSNKRVAVESPLELAKLLERGRSTAYRILNKGEGWQEHNIQHIEPMSKEEYYRLYINW